MVIDTSAVLAILFDEDDARVYADAIAGAETRRISVVNVVEAGIVVDNQAGPASGRHLDLLIDRSQFRIEPVVEAHAALARQAYLEFGKGNHRAALNFGDCFAYALAKATGEPLLFKGEDFSLTDIVPAR